MDVGQTRYRRFALDPDVDAQTLRLSTAAKVAGYKHFIPYCIDGGAYNAEVRTSDGRDHRIINIKGNWYEGVSTE